MAAGLPTVWIGRIRWRTTPVNYVGFRSVAVVT